MFAGRKAYLEKIAKYMEASCKDNLAMIGWGEPSEHRVRNPSITWAQQGIECESDHRHADKLIEESGLRKTQMVVTPAIREPGTARKKEDDMARWHRRWGGSAGMCNANRCGGEWQRHEDGRRRDRRRHGWGSPPSGQQRANRCGLVGGDRGLSERKHLSGPACKQDSNGARMSAKEATRQIVGCSFLGRDRPDQPDRPDTQYAAIS